MEVQIDLRTPFTYHAGDKVPDFKFRGDVILTTDPGKTNMAIVIGTVFGVRLAILQFRAPGYANDNSTYCHDFKTFLKEYLKNCRVAVFAIEAAISKKGMNHHRSSMVLTEIRANLIDLAYSLTGDKAIEVNNWSWKYAILPDGMRSQTEKGSTRFLPTLYGQYGNADVTDSVCIYQYAVEKFGSKNYTIIPNEPETCLWSYRYLVVPTGFGKMRKARKFYWNPGLTLAENISYALNRTTENVYAEVPVESISLEDIYGHASMFNVHKMSPNVEVLALRQ